MALSRQEVEHIAQLARLGATDEEFARYTQQLSSVLEYVETLNAVDVSGVDYEYHVGGLENVCDEDRELVRGEDECDMLCGAFPDRDGDSLRVKGVFE